MFEDPGRHRGAELVPHSRRQGAAASRLYGQSTAFGQVPLAQRIAAGYDLLYRLGKDYEKPEFGIKTVKVDGHEVVIHESVELEKPFVVLEHDLPGRDQIASIAHGVATEPGELPEGAGLAAVLDAAAGLTRVEAENAFALSLVRSAS